ncbi:MAG TPA: radical SAM protein [Paludibacteraceae bacterium]|nr:radical SAM protein [Paludibacteraceae bacterium]HPH63717.1 radical SAM protein [Paludibacteraceae bacterium]
MKHSNIPIFIPELACPHQCIFCNQSKISGQKDIPQPEDIPAIIESHLATMNDGREIEIAFFGGSFTGIPYDLQERYLSVAYKYMEAGKINGIRLSTRPDYINEKILDRLKRYGVKTIELGAQSTDDTVLLASGRGHKSEAIRQASELILKNGFHLGLQMMIGLPQDNYERSSKTVDDIISLGADNTRIYPTLVIKGTQLAKLYEMGHYKPLDIPTAISWAKEFYLRFEKANVKVLRVGLHPSEELDYNKSLLAGPYHKSFMELMMSAIWRDILERELKERHNEQLRLTVNPHQVNFVWGYQGSNKDLFQSKNLEVKISGDKALSKYEIKISHC